MYFNILSNDDHNGIATLQAQSIPMVVESVLAVRVTRADVVTLADSDPRSVVVATGGVMKC